MHGTFMCIYIHMSRCMSVLMLMSMSTGMDLNMDMDVIVVRLWQLWFLRSPEATGLLP